MDVKTAGKMTKSANSKQLQPPPPPPPPLPRWNSVTRREIDKFWRKKRLSEEDHFLAAIKAAARIRATHFSEEDYLLFMESLEEDNINEQDDNATTDTHQKKGVNGNNQEIRVGIKDWWTKSKYAYLNQPAVGSTRKPSRRSNYVPNKICFNYYNNFKPAAASASATA